MRLYKMVINEKEYAVKLKDVSVNEIHAEVNDKVYTVAIKDIQKLGGEKVINTIAPSLALKTKLNAKVEATSGVAITGGTIVSPIPGQIKLILVKSGDKVTKGQKVLMLEAMKLENDINASVAGTIKKVHVSEGQTVIQNQVLVELE